ncbi:MAG: Hsp20/alpha crystallin family protein [Desulfobacterales bacterium]|nr:Hsp20/alpha crystallin family protein [Deltaproteobacteria bacterium]NNK93910.1 Hsp20/alpha crystallin family protein [Desulfobacterales bacterium]
MFAKISDIDRMLDTMGLLRGRLDNVFSNFDRPVGYGSDWSVMGNYPRTNLIDMGEKFELVAEIPGVSKDAIDLKIQGNYLEISGTRKISAPEGYRVHRSERGSASFTRSLTLPADVDSGKVTATLKDGILVLTLPKSEAAKPRQISIN